MMLDPFDLNLRHLLALSAIVQRGSMSAAADAVSLSQPALTQGLAKLEGQLGVKLFHRRPDGMTPTAHGAQLAGRVDAAFRLLGDATRTPGRGFARPERLMTATQLRAFLALADAGSFLAAARQTGLSQPAIHRAARDLEQVLGVALAERRGRSVALTASGRRMARAARLAAREIAAAIAEIGAADEASVIVIGAMPLCRAELLPAALAAFVRHGPSPRITIIEGSWRELVEPLRDGVLDLMIGALRDGPSPPDLAQLPLFEDRLIVVAGPHHPLAHTPAPTLEQLAGFAWIVGPASSPLRELWQTLFAGHALPPAPIECGSVMTIRGLLRATDYLTLLSPDQVGVEVAGGLLAQVGGKLARCVRTIGVTTRLNWRPTPAQQRLLGLLSEARQGQGSAPCPAEPHNF